MTPSEDRICCATETKNSTSLEVSMTDFRGSIYHSKHNGGSDGYKNQSCQTDQPKNSKEWNLALSKATFLTMRGSFGCSIKQTCTRSKTLSWNSSSASDSWEWGNELLSPGDMGISSGFLRKCPPDIFFSKTSQIARAKLRVQVSLHFRFSWEKESILALTVCDKFLTRQLISGVYVEVEQHFLHLINFSSAISGKSSDSLFTNIPLWTGLFACFAYFSLSDADFPSQIYFFGHYGASCSVTTVVASFSWLLILLLCCW